MMQQTGSNTERIMLTASDVAGMLDITPRTLWRLVARGEIVQPVRFGGSTRWRRAELTKWIEAGCPPLSSTRQ